MSDSVETRILEMQLDNDQFEKGIKTTIASLEELEDKLELKDAGNGFEKITAAANTIQFDAMERSLDTITDKFSLLGNIGLQALERISNKIVDIGENIIKGISITPITDGWREFEMKTNSTQTILGGIRNQYADEASAIHAIGTELDRLNDYADQTIYNFAQMTENVGKFTNQNIGLKTATAAIKGIGNWAAMVGADSAQMSRAMYNISQSLGGGAMKLVDWKSIRIANMATPEVQKLFANVARAKGALKDKNGRALQAGSKKEKEMFQSILKDFEGSLKSGWMTNDVMMTAFKILSNEMSEVDLMKLFGDTDEGKKLVAQYKEMGEYAAEAATKVKTVTQLIGVLQESLGSGWATTFEKLFGGFQKQTEFLTYLSKLIGDFIDRDSKERNAWVTEFVKGNNGMEHVANVAARLVEIFLDLWSIVREVGKSLANPFGGAYGGTFFSDNTLNEVGLTAQNISNIFDQISIALGKLRAWFGRDIKDKNITTPYENVVKIFRGLGSVVGIALNALTSFWKFSMRIGALFLPLASSILGLFGGIGDVLYSIYANLLGQHTFDRFFQNLYDVIQPVISAVVGFASAVVELIKALFGLDKGTGEFYSFTNRFGRPIRDFTKWFSELPKLIVKAANAISNFTNGVTKGFRAINKHVRKEGVTPFEDLVSIVYEFVEAGFGKDTADTVRKWIDQNITGTLKGMVAWMANSWQSISNFFTTLPDKFNSLITRLKEAFQAFGSYDYDNSLTGLENFKERLAILLTTLFGEDTGEKLLKFYTDNIEPAITAIAGMIESAFGEISRVFRGIVHVLQGEYDGTDNPFDLLQEIALNFLEGYDEGRTTPDVLKRRFSILELFKNLAETYETDIKPYLDQVQGWFTNELPEAIENIRRVLFGYDQENGQIFDPSLGPAPTEHIAGIFERIWDWAQTDGLTTVNNIVGFFRDTWGTIEEFLFGPEAVVDSGKGEAGTIGRTGGIIDRISEIFNQIIDWFNGDGKALLDRVVAAIQDTWNRMYRFLFGYDRPALPGSKSGSLLKDGNDTHVDGVIDTVSGVFERILNWTDKDGNSIVNKITTFFSDSFEKINTFLFGPEGIIAGKEGDTYGRTGGAFDEVVAFLDPIWKWISEKGEAVYNYLTTHNFQEMWDGLNEFLFGSDKIADAGKGSAGTVHQVEGVLTPIIDVLTPIAEFFKSVGTSVFDRIKGIDFSAVWDKIRIFFLGYDEALLPATSGKAMAGQNVTHHVDGLFDRIANVFDRIVTFFESETWKNIKESVSQFYHDVIEPILGFGNGLFGTLLTSIKNWDTSGLLSNVLRIFSDLGNYSSSELPGLIETVLGGFGLDTWLENIAPGWKDLFFGKKDPAEEVVKEMQEDLPPETGKTREMDPVSEFLSGALSWLVPSASAEDALDQAGQTIRDATDGFSKKATELNDAFEENRNTLGGIVGSILSAAGTFFSGLTSDLGTIGNVVFAGLALSKTSDIVQALTGHEKDSWIQDVADVFHALSEFIGSIAMLVGIIAADDLLNGDTKAVDKALELFTRILLQVVSWLGIFGFGSAFFEGQMQRTLDTAYDNAQLNYSADFTSVSDSIKAFGEGFKAIADGIQQIVKDLLLVIGAEWLMDFIITDDQLKKFQDSEKQSNANADKLTKLDLAMSKIGHIIDVLMAGVNKIMMSELWQTVIYGGSMSILAGAVYTLSSRLGGGRGIRTQTNTYAGNIMAIGSLIESISGAIGTLLTAITASSLFTDFKDTTEIDNKISVIERITGVMSKLINAMTGLVAVMAGKDLTNALQGVTIGGTGMAQITTGGKEAVTNAAQKFQYWKLLGFTLGLGLICLALGSLAELFMEWRLDSASNVVYTAIARIKAIIDAINSMTSEQNSNAREAVTLVGTLIQKMADWGDVGVEANRKARFFLAAMSDLSLGFEAISRGVKGYDSGSVNYAFTSIASIMDYMTGDSGPSAAEFQGKASLIRLAAQNLEEINEAFKDISDEDVTHLAVVKLYVSKFQEISEIFSAISALGNFGAFMSVGTGFDVVPFLDFIEHISEYGGSEKLKESFNKLIEALPDDPELLKKLRSFTDEGGGNIGLFVSGLGGLNSALTKYAEVMNLIGTQSFTEQAAALKVIDSLGQAMKDTDYALITNNTALNANTRLGLFANDVLSLANGLQKLNEASIKADGTDFDIDKIADFFERINLLGKIIEHQPGYDVIYETNLTNFVSEFNLLETGFEAFVQALNIDGFDPELLNTAATFVERLADVIVKFSPSLQQAASALKTTALSRTTIIGDETSIASEIMNNLGSSLPALGTGIQSFYTSIKDDFKAYDYTTLDQLTQAITVVKNVCEAAAILDSVKNKKYDLGDLATDLWSENGTGLFNVLPSIINSAKDFDLGGLKNAEDAMNTVGGFADAVTKLIISESGNTSYTGIDSVIEEMSRLIGTDFYPALTSMSLPVLWAYASAFGDLSNAMTLGGKTATLANAVNQVLEELKDQEIQIRVTPVWNWGDEVPEGLTVSPTPITGASVNNNYAQNAVQNILFPEVQTVHLTADDMGTLTQSISQSNNATKTAVDAAGNKLYGLRVQLDTGVLVGQLVDKINRRLGAQNRHNPFYPVMDNSSDDEP